MSAPATQPPSNREAALPLPPPPPRRTARVVEIALVAVAFATGLGLTAFAMATEPEETEVRGAISSPTPDAASPAGGTGSSPSPHPAGDDPVSFASGTSTFTPGGSLGCLADVIFVWEADLASDPPFGSTARIRVTGPGVAGIHEAELNRNELRLELRVSLTGDDRWTARPISVGDRTAVGSPLEVTSDTPFC